jgi:putative ABC transport system permease protein
VFSFRLLQGDPHTALAAPAAIILTESLAEKYFGTEDPIGQSLRTISNGEEGTLLVTGIIEDPPPYSHLIFDFVLSMTTSSQYRHQLETNQWDSDYYLTYVSLQPGYNLPAFEEKLIVLGQKYLGRLSNYQNKPDEISIFYPQSLGAIHLRSGLNHEVDTEGSINYVYLFSGIGLLILLIACINYTNMTMARSVIREREIGVRKVMGAQRPQLVGQFMSEALILSVVATVLAVGLVYLLLPSFNALTARAISPDWASQPGLWLTIIGLAIGVGCLTGGYPALVLSGLAPLGMMRKRQRRADNRTLRNGLVVAQFAITTMLIVCTLTIRQQVHYIQTANTGIEREQVILIRLVDQAAINQYEAIRQVLLEDPNVMGVTASRQDPTKIGSWTEAKEWEGAEEGQRLSFYHSAVRQGFLELLGIELVEGLDITGASESRDGLLINETMVRQLGWEHPVGKRINFQGREVRIAGVMKDFNFLSFHQAIAPLAFYQSEEWPFARLLVKVNPQQMQATLAHLESTMATFSPAYPFTYEFLDDVYNQMYQTEVRLGELFSYFTGIALVIAYMGLLGLAAFLASRRTKEIGVRKVLGASLSDILRLLSKDFLRLVGVAFIVGAPMAAIAMHRWLEDYVYRISLGWETFVIAGGAVLLLAWLSVSYQSMRAALINPVQSLRHK